MTSPQILPTRALILWCSLVPVLGSAGIIAASWLLPAIIALRSGGLGGLSHIPVELYGWAHAPDWIDPVRDAPRYGLIDLCSLVLGIPAAVFFAVLGHRLWRYLGVKKLHWIGDEDVERFNKTQQYM